ncbi:MAG TPA: hypothetical protein DCX06_14385 [Opitutae bacterium]|nr:hypothetical protein [Opitutae bacterium]
MPNANFKRLLFILLSLTLFGLIGCSGPKEKKASSLADAAELQKQGKNDAALVILEALAEEYPNDPSILRQIGEIFKAQGDTTMAAFFLEQAHQQSPNDIELLYQTYSALVAADQPAGVLLEKLATQSPESMTPGLWQELGKHYAEANKTQSALDAYLKGVNPDKVAPSAETAAAIGKLFIQLENPAQAERWLSLAADNDSPDALTALFGLLKLRLDRKNWEGAEAIISRIDKQFPGAVDASEWSSTRTELIGWRNAQEQMRADMAITEKAQKALEEAKKTVNATVAPDTSTEIDTPATNEPANTEGKAQIIADMEAAEALATTPALEADESAGSTEGTTTVTFDPNIAIQPAEPDLSFEVSYDQQSESTPTTYAVQSTTDVDAIESTLEDATTPIQTNNRPRPIEELLDEANAATIDKNYRLAITNYWQALGTANDRDDIWNLLSRAYLIDGQNKNAETTALEAIRLSPRDINYTLDYLRAAQRSKTPSEFFAELETAYDRFPESPEVTLSLARGYERIAKNNTAASTLYQRFIDLAPSHPLRPEAEAAIKRLQ